MAFPRPGGSRASRPDTALARAVTVRDRSAPVVPVRAMAARRGAVGRGTRSVAPRPDRKSVV